MQLIGSANDLLDRRALIIAIEQSVANPLGIR